MSADRLPPSDENIREVKYIARGDFGEIVQSLQTALLITTRQAGKLIAVSAVDGKLRFSFHNFDRPMGIALSSTQLAVASRHQVWLLRNAADITRHSDQPHDACFLTRASQFTDEIKIHEMAWCRPSPGVNELWVVNTLFSCLCTLSGESNFVPRWRPTFITELVAEDRCHLNGLAVQDGQAKFVTALAESNIAAGWREHKSNGGVVIDVPSGEIIANGFCMPHSPRIHRDQLLILDSGTGRLVALDQTSDERTPIAQMPGFLRGLALRDRFAFVGLSKIRETSTFGEIPIAKHPDDLRCGVGVVDLVTGRSVASLEFTSGVDEIFDIQLTDQQRHPNIVGPMAASDGRAPIWYLPADTNSKEPHSDPPSPNSRDPHKTFALNPLHRSTAIHETMDRMQWQPSKVIVDWQLQQVRRLLEHCHKHVPYYRDLLNQHSIRPTDIQSMDDFRRLPILQRSTVQQQSQNLLAVELPPDQHFAGHSHTSGTTGVPVTVHRTDVVASWWLACFIRDCCWAGMNPMGRLAAIRKLAEGASAAPETMQGIALPNWGEGFRDFFRSGPSYLMDISQDPRVQLQWLAKVNPHYIVSYPSNLESLASLAQESNLRLTGLQAIHAIAEELTIAKRERIESAFGVPVKNSYTCEEAGYVASPCPDTENYHVHAENALLEVIDADGRACRPGETGQVVLTTLHNHLMPLVRYAIGDAVELAPQDCSCGRGLPTLRRIAGKARPQLILPDGQQKSSHVLAGNLRTIGGFHQFQFVQCGIDSVLLRIVPDQQWDESKSGSMRTMLGEFFQQRSLDIEIKTTDHIEPSQSGKLQSFICNL